MQRVYKAGEVAGSGLPGLKGEFQKSPKTILEGLNLGDLARRMQLAKVFKKKILINFIYYDLSLNKLDLILNQFI